jgi:glycerol uptake facilitator protein
MSGLLVRGPSLNGKPSGAAAGAAAHRPYSMFNASIAEFFGTMVLLWGIMGIGDTKPSIGGLGALLVGLVVLSVGLSLGGPSGYSINPARDLGPRIFGALVGTQGLFTGLYWLIVPVLVPAFSGAVGLSCTISSSNPSCPRNNRLSRK